MPPYPLPKGWAGVKYAITGFGRKLSWKVKSYPVIPVLIIASIGLIVSGLAFLLFESETRGLPEALSFGVTTSALVVGVLIFAIQTYPTLHFSLSLSTKDAGASIRFDLNIENVGIAACAVNITYDNDFGPVAIISEGKAYKTGDSSLLDGDMILIPKSRFAPLPFLIWSQVEIDATKTLNKSPNLLIQVEPHGFMYKHIIGATRIIFTYEDIKRALDTLTTSSSTEQSITIWEHKYSYDGIPQKGGSAQYGLK